MKKVFDDIREFHEKFELGYDGKPRAIGEDMAEFRSKFGLEEIVEYENSNALANKASDDRDSVDYTYHLAGIMDAFVDQLYVLAGTIYLHGMAGQFEEAWDRVHQANMTKIRTKRAEDSKRGSEYDVVKPKGWVAPKHEDLVEDNNLEA